MFKNKKKGVALISTIILMSVVVCVFLLLTTLLMSGVVSNKFQTQKLKNQTTISKVFKDFADNQTIDETYDFDVQIYTNQSNTNQKAVVAKKQGASATKMFYYCICEFDAENPTTYQKLAEQDKDFYLTIREVDGVEYYFLADLIKYVEV